MKNGLRITPILVLPRPPKKSCYKSFVIQCKIALMPFVCIVAHSEKCHNGLQTDMVMEFYSESDEIQ